MKSYKIEEVAVLVNFNCSQWAARKFDKKISNEVNQQHNAASDAGRYNKLLIAKDKLCALPTIYGEAYNYHVTNTLPWADKGFRILPVIKFEEYNNKMEDFKDKFDEAADQFEKVYPELVESEKDRLNGMWSADDYPPPWKIRSKFKFKTRFIPIPTQDDFRVVMRSDQIEKVKEAITQDTQEQLKAAMDDVWQRLYGVVERMHEKLKEPGAIFRNSLVENIAEVCALLPGLNITQDVKLEEMRRKIESKLTIYDPDDLRKEKEIRKEVTETAKSIMDEMSVYFGAPE